jgi:hypothetical protein
MEIPFVSSSPQSVGCHIRHSKISDPDRRDGDRTVSFWQNNSFWTLKSDPPEHPFGCQYMVVVVISVTPQDSRIPESEIPDESEIWTFRIRDLDSSNPRSGIFESQIRNLRIRDLDSSNPRFGLFESEIESQIRNLRIRDLDSSNPRFGLFKSEIWILRIRDLESRNPRFGLFESEIWTLRIRDLDSPNPRFGVSECGIRDLRI